MSVSGESAGSATRDAGAAVVCDPSAYNVRFLRAAMQKLGFDDVAVARTVDELVRFVAVGRVDVVVFDPAMGDGAGFEAIDRLKTAAPSALFVAFCSDDELGRAAKSQGIITVEKVSILKLDALVETIANRTGRQLVDTPEAIPAADFAVPVWDEVPSLVEP